MADTYDINATQGSTLLLQVTLKDSSNNYINLNGYSVRGFVRDKYSATGILLNLNPQVHSSLVSGIIIISGAQDQMSAMKVGSFPYDIEISGNSTNYVTKPLRGYININPECTI